MRQSSNNVEQNIKQTGHGPASGRKRTRAGKNMPESKKNVVARPHLNVEAEKSAARARGKQVQRGQGRMTHPKTNQSNQYR